MISHSKSTRISHTEHGHHLFRKRSFRQIVLEAIHMVEVAQVDHHRVHDPVRDCGRVMVGNRALCRLDSCTYWVCLSGGLWIQHLRWWCGNDRRGHYLSMNTSNSAFSLTTHPA